MCHVEAEFFGGFFKWKKCLTVTVRGERDDQYHDSLATIHNMDHDIWISLQNNLFVINKNK